MTGGENFLDRDGAILLLHAPYILDRFGYPCLSRLLVGGELSDRPTMPGDDDGFATFNVIEKLGKARLGLGGLDLSHGVIPFTDRSN